MPLTYLSPLHRAVRQIGIWFEEQTTGVATSEGHLLTYLVPYGPCPVADLVRVFGVKHSTMTSILDRLEERGLIERTTNPEDRRSLLIAVTKKGAKSASRINAMIEELEKAIATGHSKSDLAGFQKVLNAVGEATHVDVRKRSKS